VPVVCLSQLNRQSEDRQGHRPRMSDLRESGSIEQDADVVMMLHREEYYHQNDENWVEANPQKRNVAEVLVLKQRNGPTGTVELMWDSRSTAFRNLVPAGRGAGVVYGAADGDLPA
jgi:replicative DNA helicase